MSNFQKVLGDLTSLISSHKSGLHSDCVLAITKIQVLSGRLIKRKDDSIYFDIEESCKANDIAFLREQREVFEKHGIKLMVRYLKP